MAVTETHTFESAVMGILAAVANADDRIDDAEAAWWFCLRRAGGVFARVPHDDMEAMLRRTRDLLETTPWAEAIAAWAPDVPPDEAERVYALALQLQQADGVAAGAERAVTRALADALGLTRERAVAVAEAVRGDGGDGI